MVTYKDIFQISSTIEENEFYSWYQARDFPHLYDANYMELKINPSPSEFAIMADIQEENHRKSGMDHIKFYFPPAEGIYADTFAYLAENGFVLGQTELYFLEPGLFKGNQGPDHLHVGLVDDSNLNDFLDFNYDLDLPFGQSYADEKRKLYHIFYKSSESWLVSAYWKGEMVGSTIIHDTPKAKEIDQLEVAENFRKKGIGSALQQFAMDWNDKPVMLLADAEDTPRLMYQKQGYQLLSQQISVQKTF